MVKLFDSTFVLGSLLVIAALALAAAALARDDLPVIGTGTGALLGVAVLGIAGCAVAGISQAPALGWTSPAVLLGAGLGLVALLLIVAGLLGWSGVLQPLAQYVPSRAQPVAPASTAIFGLALVIGAKWVIATLLAATSR